MVRTLVISVSLTQDVYPRESKRRRSEGHIIIWAILGHQAVTAVNIGANISQCKEWKQCIGTTEACNIMWGYTCMCTSFLNRTCSEFWLQLPYSSIIHGRPIDVVHTKLHCRPRMVAFRTSSHTAESEAEISRIRHHSPPYQYRLDDGYLCALKRPSCVTRPWRRPSPIDHEDPWRISIILILHCHCRNLRARMRIRMVMILHDLPNMSKQGEGQQHWHHVPFAQVMPTRGLGDVDLESAGFLAAACPECRRFGQGTWKLTHTHTYIYNIYIII